MSVLLVFNELSATPIAPDLGRGQKRLEDFSNILIDARIKGRKMLVTPPYFPQMEISAGYSVGRWLSEYKHGDHERRLRIKTLVDRRSHYSEFVSADQDIEYRLTGQLAEGLSVAFSSDGLALSFRSSDQWNVTSVTIEKSWVAEQDVETRALDVLHASCTDHLESHVEWLRKKEPPPPANGLQVWNDRASLFPRLAFCDSVEDQITRLGGNEPRFKAIMRGLQDLQNYCESWNTANFDIHRLANASGESEPTLNMYRDERTFKCPDGEYRVFEWHLKRGDTRIHFFDFPEKKRILVGYVGAHLRISSQ